MLVQFMVKNVLSFKEETVLDMTAIKAYKEHECNLIDIGMKEKFLRVAAIYGANASGKSNLYMAMSLFQRIIMLERVKKTQLTDIMCHFLLKKQKRIPNSKLSRFMEDTNTNMGLNTTQNAL